MIGRAERSDRKALLHVAWKCPICDSDNQDDDAAECEVCPDGRRLAGRPRTVVELAPEPEPPKFEPELLEPEPPRPELELPTSPGPRRAARVVAGLLTGLFVIGGISYVAFRPSRLEIETAEHWRAGKCVEAIAAIEKARTETPGSQAPLQVGLKLIAGGGGCVDKVGARIFGEALKAGIDVSRLPVLVEIRTVYGKPFVVRPAEIRLLGPNGVEMADGSRYRARIRLRSE